MKIRVVLFFILLSFFTNNNTSLSQSSSNISIDYDSNIEAIYANISIVQNSIYSLKKNLSNLKKKINKDKKLRTNMDIEITNRIDTNVIIINELKEEFYNIEVDYSKVLIEINELKNNIVKFDSVLAKLQSTTYSLIYDFQNLKKDYILLKKEIRKIPEIMFCENCFPKYTIGFSMNKFLVFNANYINSSPSFSLTALYNFNNKSSLWFNYISPFVVTITSDIDNTYHISDHWNTNVLSLGILHNISLDKNNKILLKMASGIFYGKYQYDKFLNTTYGFERNRNIGTDTWGLNLKSTIAYSEFKSKNPLEIYMGVGTLISFDKVILDPGINKPHDLGRVLVSVFLGINFNFWGI